MKRVLFSLAVSRLSLLPHFCFLFAVDIFPSKREKKKRHTASSVHRFLLFCFFSLSSSANCFFCLLVVFDVLPLLLSLVCLTSPASCTVTMSNRKNCVASLSLVFFSSEFLYSRVGRARTASFFFVCVCVRLCVFVHVCMWCASIFFFSVISFLFSRLFFLFFFLSPLSVFQLPSSRQHTSAHTHTHSILCAWLTERHVSLSMQRGKVFLTLTMRSASNTVHFYRIV